MAAPMGTTLALREKLALVSSHFEGQPVSVSNSRTAFSTTDLIPSEGQRS
jgi:hypothetical protein